MASCSKRFARVLADVRQDIDNFLDPAVLSLTDHNAKAAATASQAVAGESPVVEELRLEVLGLRGEGETLLAKFEDTHRDLESSRLASERRASQDASQLARLQQSQSELERDGRAKKRRAQEAEGEVLQLRGERDALACELTATQSEREELTEEGEGERRRLSDEVRRLNEDLATVRARSAAAAAAAAVPSAAAEVGGAAADKEALRAQVSCLQDEVASLQLVIEQAAPDRQLAAQLRQRHAEYEDELVDLRASKAEFIKLRSQTMRLEQEETKLRAALESRSNALGKAEEEAHGASLAKRDLAAFVAAASAMVAEQRTEGTEAPCSDAVPSPVDLRLAWARLQGEVSDLRRLNGECQQSLDQTKIRECRAQSELGQLRATVATTQARLEEQQLELRRAQDESAALTARTSVLRKAIASHTPGEAPVAAQVNAGEELRTQVETERRRAGDFQAAADSKQRAIDSLTAELSALRQEHTKLSEMEVKAGQFQRANEDLRRANGELERDQERLVADVEAAKREAGLVTRDYDPSTTKILHFRHGPGATFAAKGSDPEALRAEMATLRDELRRLRGDASGSATATGDLECRQATRQLERFKKATKKYVQDFREGTYRLLGWKVEMKGDGNAMKWHLTSIYQDGQELVFQLRPGEAGSSPQFDLLSTPWGEQLQADRHAMAYLEVYRSIPGFLAHITADLLSRHTIPG